MGAVFVGAWQGEVSVKHWRHGLVACFVGVSLSVLVGCAQVNNAPTTVLAGNRQFHQSSRTSVVATPASQVTVTNVGAAINGANPGPFITPTPKPLAWVIGDSVADGWYTTNDEGFPYYLTAVSSPLITANDQGDASQILATVQGSNHPSSVVNEIIEAGTYDMTNGTPREEFQTAYTALINLPVSRTHLTCLGVWWPSNYTNSVGVSAADYDTIISQLCTQAGGTFVSLQTIYAQADSHCSANMFYPEGAHKCDDWSPSNLGDQRIGQSIKIILPS